MEKNPGLEEMLTWCKVGHKTTLYIATHPDDSCFNAGTLCLLKNHQVTVKVCLVTLGEAGFTTEPKAVKKRREEFEKECKITGAEPIYLDTYLRKVYPCKSSEDAFMIDGKVKDNELMRDAFVRLLRDEKPSVLYIPSTKEKHYDHQEVRKCIEKALWRSGRPSQLGREPGKLGEPEHHFPSQMKVYEYETITMSLGQGGLTYVDITEVWDKKSAAFGTHKSQIVRDPILYVVAPKANSEARGRELYLPRELTQKVESHLSSKLQSFLNPNLASEELQQLPSDQFMEEVINWAFAHSPKAESFRPL